MDRRHRSLLSLAKKRMKARKYILAEYLVLGLACAALATLVSAWILDLRLTPVTHEYRRPLWAMLALMPFELLVLTMAPPGWLFWLGFALTIWHRSRWFLAVSVLASLWAGALCPQTFWNMMSV